MYLMRALALALTTLVLAGQAFAQTAWLDEFDQATLGPEWTVADRYAETFPADVVNHATVGLANDALGISFIGGVEHNQWEILHTQVTRSYLGSGTYETVMETGLTGSQQFGIVFQGDHPHTFLMFMFYVGSGNILGYVERFVSTGGGGIVKYTIPDNLGVDTGLDIPDAGPYYIRVVVDDDPNPTQRTFDFEWSQDGTSWSSLISGVLEGSSSTTNIGAIQHVGVFTGNQPAGFDGLDAEFGYFSFDTDQTVVLQPPQNLSVVASDATSVTLDWDGSAGASTYRLYRTPDGGAEVLANEGTATDFVDTGLTTGVEVSYRVTAVNGAEESGSSNVVTVTPTAPVPPMGPPANMPSDLVLRLDAEDAALSYTFGQDVDFWTDLSGSGHHATVSGSARPTLVSSAIAGRPALRFDGVDDHFSLAAGFTDFTGGFTVYTVARVTQPQTGFKFVALGNGPGADMVVLGRALDTDRLQFFTSAPNGSVGWFNTDPDFVAGAPAVYSASHGAGSQGASVTGRVSIDGEEIGSNSVYVGAVTSRTVNYIGRSYWPEGWLQGDVAEVLIFDRELNSAERTIVEGYIYDKYGVGDDPTPDPVPDTPTGLAAVAGDGTVGLSWNAVTGADGYRLYRGVGASPASYDLVYDGANLSYADNGVTNGAEYAYAVSAYSTGGESAQSADVLATPTGGGGPPDPPAIPSAGLALHLDAAAAEADFGDGGVATTWRDASGLGLDATASAGAAPTVVSNGLNGEPVLSFDGVDDHFALPSGFADFTAGLSMYAVVRPTALQSGFKMVALGNGVWQQMVVLGRAGNTDGLQYFTSSPTGLVGWFNTSPALQAGVASWYGVHQPGGDPGELVTAEVEYDGDFVDSGLVYVPPVQARSTSYLGRSYWPEGWFQGDMAEIIIYSRELTNAERQTVEDYLHDKYGLGDPPVAGPPATPTGLDAVPGDQQVTASWDAVPGVDGYRLRRAIGASTTFTVIYDGTSTNFLDTGLTNDVEHRYTVTAYDAAGESADSSEVSATPVATAPDPPPATPSGLGVSVAPAGVTASWDAVGDADGYRLWRAIGTAASYDLIYDGTSTTFLDVPLSGGVAQHYAVTAYNAGGESALSAEVTALQPLAPPAGIPSTGLVLALDAASALGDYGHGAAVPLWRDASAIGGDATGTSGRSPTVSTSGIGGQPVLVFDGVDDRLALPSDGFSDFLDGVTMYVVARPTVLQTGFKLVALGNGAGNDMVVFSRSGGQPGLQYFTSRADGAVGWFNTGFAMSAGTPSIYHARQPGGNAGDSVTAVVESNGVQVGSGSVYVPHVTSRNQNWIGQSYWNEGRFEGELAEILIYDRELDAAERASVQSYLTTKYGL